MKKCTKCGINERVYEKKSYCRTCKSAMDLASYHKNSTKRKQYRKEYLDNNPDKREKMNNQVKEWRQKNPKYITDWIDNKIKTDPNYYLKSRISNSLGMSLKGGKLEKTVWYLGCSIKDLKIHLEKQFTEGMNWDNKGKFGWHIDHIKPLNTFNLENIDEIKACWHYTNLRPLWWYDNIRRPKNGSDIKN